jgi:hypothetical protein
MPSRMDAWLESSSSSPGVHAGVGFRPSLVLLGRKPFFTEVN